MKTIRLLTAFAILFFMSALQAQVSVKVKVGVPPPWGPVGYNEVHYYYLPDVEAYYDVPSSMFIYNEGGVWVHRTYLPSRYKNYDLYGGYKVVMKDYHGHTPYTEFKEHKMRYGRGYHGEPQRTIGERPGKGHYDYKDGDHNKNKENSSGHGNDKKEDHGHDNGNDRKDK